MPRGVLLLGELTARNALEVVYLGLVPAARGKGLREALLHDLASKALRQGEASAAVGVRLGFSDESAFARAFRRWSGQTPVQFARCGPTGLPRQPPTIG